MSEGKTRQFQVLLFRHPEVESNISTNGLPDVFTEKGNEQLKVIAAYSKIIIGELLPKDCRDNVAFVTSCLERSVNTARAIADANKITVSDYRFLERPNLYRYEQLDEQPVIGLTGHKKCKEAKKHDITPKSIDDVGRTAEECFFYIAGEHRQGLVIISPLHGQVNQAILHYLKKTTPDRKKYLMNNGDMYHLLYINNGWVVSDLIAYETIKSAIEKQHRKH